LNTAVKRMSTMKYMGSEKNDVARRNSF